MPKFRNDPISGPTLPNQITGARRITPTMLLTRDEADSFTGLPRGTAKPFQLLSAFEEAAPYLCLPPHAFKLICFLVKQTRPQDWEEGSRPIAWPSARLQAEKLELSPTRVKALNRALCEAGLFVIRDNEQGKRYGRRSADGRIIEAFGFDLSPLALRHDEFIRVAAEAKVERDRMKALRKRVTLARRGIRQIGETLAGLGPLPEGWPRLQAETAKLVAAARGAGRSEQLAPLVQALEQRKAEAEQWVRDRVTPVESDPVGAVFGPHNTDTNSSENLSDTVIAGEESGPVERPEPQPEAGPVASPPSLPSPPAVSSPPPSPEKLFRLKAAQLLDLIPLLARYILTDSPTWRDIVDAVGTLLRPSLGVSLSLWGDACRIMGREHAALAMALLLTKDIRHFRVSPAAYFAGMVRKAEKGELHMERTIWALRSAKWGKADRRMLN